MNRLHELRQFLDDVRSELRKTTWPNRREVYGTTLVVIATVLICATFLWVVDFILRQGMEAVFRVGT